MTGKNASVPRPWHRLGAVQPGLYVLDLYRGDSYVWLFTVWADAAKTVPADLTDVVARAEVRTAPGGTLLLELPCVIDGNEITMELPADAWGTDTARKGSWDLELTYPDGPVRTILAGSVAITTDVTTAVAVRA